MDVRCKLVHYLKRNICFRQKQSIVPLKCLEKQNTMSEFHTRNYVYLLVSQKGELFFFFFSNNETKDD